MKLQNKDLNVTKRNVLKQVASTFDPLGLFAPGTMNGKVLWLCDHHAKQTGAIEISNVSEANSNFQEILQNTMLEDLGSIDLSLI